MNRSQAGAWEREIRIYMEITLQVKSSSGDFYDVIFIIAEERCIVKCNCQAGIYGQICKHKLTLLSGDKSLLFDGEQVDKFNNLQELLKETKIKELSYKLISIKREIEEKKKEESRIKKLIEREIK
jgi:hypothetical protein